jgi:rhizosphere induced protein
MSSNTGTQYNVVATNNSTTTWNFYMYQKMPGPASPNVFSLAWFVYPVAPTTTVKFTWYIRYSFVWSRTGVLVPGVTFEASQDWSADPAGLSSGNLVNFGINSSSAPTFYNQAMGGSSGSLSIFNDNTVPASMYSVGIGMSGAGTYVVQGQPNTTTIFTPSPSYFISFGNQIQQGQVLETVVGNSQQITFPTSVYTMYAALGGNNLWTISQAEL